MAIFKYSRLYTLEEIEEAGLTLFYQDSENVIFRGQNIYCLFKRINGLKGTTIGFFFENEKKGFSLIEMYRLLEDKLGSYEGIDKRYF
jgi:hypothetical protein